MVSTKDNIAFIKGILIKVYPIRNLSVQQCFANGLAPTALEILFYHIFCFRLKFKYEGLQFSTSAFTFDQLYLTSNATV